MKPGEITNIKFGLEAQTVWHQNEFPHELGTLSDLSTFHSKSKDPL